MAGRDAHPPRAGAVVHHAEEREEMRPGAVALIHGVRVKRLVGAQPLEERHQRVVLDERLVLVGQQVPLLGVEQEDEPENHGEQGAIDLVRVLSERVPQQRAAARRVRRLDAAQQVVEAAQHLDGQLFAHFVLVLAAFGQQRRQPLGLREREQAGLVQQQPERREQRAPGGLRHLVHHKIHGAGALPAGSGDQSESFPVEQQPGGNARLAQQTLHPAVGGRPEPARSGEGLVQFLVGGVNAHRELPRFGTAPGTGGRPIGRQRFAHRQSAAGGWLRRVRLPYREIGGERLVVFGKMDGRQVRRRVFAFPGVPLRRDVPVQHRLREPPEGSARI